MKHLLIMTLFAFMTVGLAAQQEAEVKEETPKADTEKVEGPKLKLESTTVDYGEIEQNSDPVRVVGFTNVGTEPLVISNAKGSCGCTVPTWPREPIAPGESSEIKIRYDTKRLGAINKTVRLTTNDEKGTYVIRITGKVHEKVAEEGLPEKEGIFDKKSN